MQFGIMAIQLGSLIPSHLTPEKLMVHISQFNQTDLVRNLADNGFSTIELSGDLGMFLPQILEEDQINGLKQIKQELGLTYTVHMPLWSVEPSTPLLPVRKGSLQALLDCINCYEPLYPEVYVLHATGALAAEFYRMKGPDIAKTILLRQFQNNARETIRELIDSSGINSHRIAIETIEFPFDLTLEIAEELDLSVCVDTGHILAGFSGEIELFQALERVLPRLAEIHLHDAPWCGVSYDPGYGTDHKVLGTGDLDVKRLLNWLNSVSFGAPIIFELNLEEAKASMEYIHRLQ